MKNAFTTEEIKERILNGFDKTYRPFTDFMNKKNDLWRKCMDMVSNPKLMNHIIFINDNLQIPPVKVFLSLPENQNIIEDLSDHEKRFIGAFWGYIFKNVFGYNEQKSVGINDKRIKTATYFSENDNKILVS
ncbi:MAG: hypothetical protein ACOCRK_09655 [bacterium]